MRDPLSTAHDTTFIIITRLTSSTLTSSLASLLLQPPALPTSSAGHEGSHRPCRQQPSPLQLLSTLMRLRPSKPIRQ